jgi:hypothetical protein
MRRNWEKDWLSIPGILAHVGAITPLSLLFGHVIHKGKKAGTPPKEGKVFFFAGYRVLM